MKLAAFACMTAVALALAAPVSAQTGSTSATTATQSNGAQDTGPSSTGTPGTAPDNSGTAVKGQTSPTGTGANDTMSNAGTTAAAGGSGSATDAMPGGSTNASMTSSASPDTCQGMMDKMNAMSGKQSAGVTSQIKAAEKAHAKGQEKSCMSHMRKAMAGIH